MYYCSSAQWKESTCKWTHVVQTCPVQESTVSGTKEIQETEDFPGGPVVKNLPSNAGDLGSIPGQGTKIPNAVRQLSPHSTTREAHALQL